ncbi:hypothetical protein PanWU01x14_107670 [Parasponia andersonii]|uniref:Uncharacterized protein n=1 Tax=Parasponia andersonii TaxID=3476 RepID=A0A2P5D098_PARAD|nr:hypothetical protein PanWU01x14_107670 [Parasponia andersonii]
MFTNDDFLPAATVAEAPPPTTLAGDPHPPTVVRQHSSAYSRL